MARRMVGRDRPSWSARSISFSSRVPDRQLAGLDQLLQVLRHLEVEGDRAVRSTRMGSGGTVHGHRRRGRFGNDPHYDPRSPQLLADQDVNMSRHTLDLTETQA